MWTKAKYVKKWRQMSIVIYTGVKWIDHHKNYIIPGIGSISYAYIYSYIYGQKLDMSRNGDIWALSYTHRLRWIDHHKYYMIWMISVLG